VSRNEDLERIQDALLRACEALRALRPEDRHIETKSTRGDLVTNADLAVNQVLQEALPREGEGWLSEETADDPARLDCRRVWVVDPLDGTQEFVEGIPEWCISIGLVEDGRPVAGGISNPATGETFLGALETGVTLNGRPARARTATAVPSEVLASRTEVKRGQWAEMPSTFAVTPMGSVAYKLARVAGGLTDATWTLVPKHEWDVAAGVALVLAGGGFVHALDWTEPVFNQRVPLLSGLVASAPGAGTAVRAFLEARASTR
jgi:myo-inositol-1(or 4)-monophosphatase